MNPLTKGKASHTYDAIVIGSGISGGWAAKELTEKGLETLVLERGRDVVHQQDYKTANLAPWELNWLNKPSREMKTRQATQIRSGYLVKPEAAHHFVDDQVHPYLEKRRFNWFRGYQTGGRSLTWGRQSYRLAPVDFEANAKDGFGIPWPISYEELSPWYDYAEKFAGISGSKEGLDQLPDGIFQPPMGLTPPELELKASVVAKWQGRHVIPGRVAHLTAPTAEQYALGRASCQFRNMCRRGCPFGAYFSSQSATLKAAANTGKMTLRPHSIVHSIIYDDESGKATGVRLIDEVTMETMEYFAKVIFLNASTIPSTAILMNSQSQRFPKGIDESGSLGRYLMDHHLRAGASGRVEGYEELIHSGRRPNGFYIPRYRNFSEKPNGSYVRGYGYQGRGERAGWNRKIAGFGRKFKEELTSFGPWQIGMQGFGECLPSKENRVYLSPDQKDRWGLPLVVADAAFGENELAMRDDIANDAAEMLEAMGAKNVRSRNPKPIMGTGIHEMGTARMGNSPKESVLNSHNQVWGAENVFCTDGAAMTSSGCQNPSLTYMALTARAADFAVSEMKKGNL